MTAEQEQELRVETILRRMRRTGRNETICLSDWEVRLLLKYIDEMERKLQ